MRKIILLLITPLILLTSCETRRVDSSSSIESSTSQIDTSNQTSSSASSSNESSSSISASNDLEEELNNLSSSVKTYYQNVNFSLTGSNLKTSLWSTIRNHKSVSYNGLWDCFKTTDRRSDGTVWDMYSNEKYTFGSDQCGNYSTEGDCYNREHSIPKSWFGDASPMYTDIFHLYPTDGKVNGMRSNYPFGEVGSATYTSKNGSKLGNSSFSGYSGKVFEPIDEYKGDFARTYFYFITCYQDKNITQTQEAKVVFTRDGTYYNLTKYATDLFLKWSEEDPVSQKEIDRNNNCYRYQNNRNPFIDLPSLSNIVFSI